QPGRLQLVGDPGHGGRVGAEAGAELAGSEIAVVRGRPGGRDRGDEAVQGGGITGLEGHRQIQRGGPVERSHVGGAVGERRRRHRPGRRGRRCGSPRRGGEGGRQARRQYGGDEPAPPRSGGGTVFTTGRGRGGRLLLAWHDDVLRSVTRLTSWVPWLCVPASRRVCPFRCPWEYRPRCVRPEAFGAPGPA